MKKRPKAKRLRVTLLGGGTAAKDLARTLRRFATVALEPAKRAGKPRSRARTSARIVECSGNAVVVDLRCGCAGGIEGLIAALTREIESNVERQISDRQSEFVSLTSHELRTPLTSSREAVSLVADGVVGSVTDEQRSYLEMASRNLARLTSVVNQLLDLADVEQDRIVLLRARLDLSDVTAAAAARWASRFAEKGVRFVPSPSRPFVAEIDGDRIGHVLDALLDNALKFTPAGGTVRVHTGGDADFVEMVVEDTGAGIPARARRRVFEKFRQLDPALTRKHGGLGLGLTLTREIVRSHGGSVRVEESAEGGSRFVIRLPRSNSPPVKAP
ncbi:MAG: HAMP domain-containing histidine kinase [Planctomycetes bacterium]|nr:HAMP domain-containing histidine kinase [Planctomycetota bacterium]